MQSHELLPLLPFLAPETLAHVRLPTRAELAAAQDGPATFMLRGNELAALKARLAGGDPVLAAGLAKLRQLADAELSGPLPSVTDKTSPPPGCDLNDYVSHAIYYWPHPKNKNSLPYVRRDGEVNPDVLDDDRYDAKRFERFVNSLFVLSLAAYLSDEPSYGERTAALLRTWFVDEATRQNPHFKYAQLVTGSASERPPGLIESRRFVYVLDAEALIASNPAWTAEDRAAFRAWFSDFFQWFRTSSKGAKAAGSANNLALWCDVQASIYALFLQEHELADTIVRDSVAKHVPGQIEPDGAQLNELARAHPYDYVAFNLLAMMGLARAGDGVGFDAWWSETADGRSFARALDWLLRVAGPDRIPTGLDQAARLAQLEIENATLSDLQKTLDTRTAALAVARARADDAESLAAELTNTLAKKELPAKKERDAALGRAEELNKRVENLNGKLEAALRQVKDAQAVAEATKATALAEADRAAEAHAKSMAGAAEAKRAVESALIEAERAHAARDVEAAKALEAARTEVQGGAAALAEQIEILDAECKRAQAYERQAQLAAERARSAEDRALKQEIAADAFQKQLEEARAQLKTAASQLARAQTNERALRAEALHAAERLKNADARINTLLASTSWRVTEPLRQAVRFARGPVMIHARPPSPRVAGGGGSAPGSDAVTIVVPGSGDVGVSEPTAKRDAPPPRANGNGAAKALVQRAAAVLDAPTRKPSVVQQGALSDYLRSLEKFVPELEKAALRHRSLPARDFLARITTGGLCGHNDIEAVLEQGRSLREHLNLGPEGFQPRAMRMLARVVGNQQITPVDTINSIALYRAFIEMFGESELRPIDHVLLVDLLTSEGRVDEARRALDRSDLASNEPIEHICLTANLLRPRDGAAPSREWVNMLSRLFTQSGFAPINLKPTDGLVMTGLSCTTASPVDGPLVSILMTTFAPDSTLSMAVESVLAQTWRNLELIISDDFSDESLFAEVKAWEQRDPRIRVIRLDRNQGTYVAKNHALELAQGEFVTCHDSDDWSHPQKIERQAQALMADVKVMANMSSWIRATPDMAMQRFSGTGRICYPNTSSLMFRREPVLSRCGYWDNVRTGADSELYRRIEAVFEQNIPVYNEPLSFGQVREGALTHQSLGNGWESSKRKFYRSAWRHWHKQSRKAKSAMQVEMKPVVRPFYAPPSILPDRPTGTEPREYDVIIASDFRMEGGSTTSSIEELKANHRAGLRTAICQINSYRSGVVAKDFLDRRVVDLIHQGIADEVDLEEDVRCKLLMLRYPPILQFTEGLKSGIKPAHTRVIVNQPPSELDGSDRRYEVGACARNAATLFGQQPMWAPIGAPARDSVRHLVPTARMSLTDWHNVIDVDEWRCDRRAFVADKPVIGRHSRDDVTKWPEDAKTLRAAYPTDGSVYVRILGGAATALRTLNMESPPGWKVARFDTTAPRKFLESIDYFVYFHHSQRVEAFGRTIIEAMAAGCVAILPHHFREVFGEGALYCEPDEVQTFIRALHADRDRYLGQSRRGVDFVVSNFGYGVHERRVRAIIGGL